MSRIDVPVLIVGAGPVGIAASILLHQQGIASRVVERRDGPHRAPQAHVVNPRTLEICRAIGIDPVALRARATPRADGSEVAWVTTLAGEELGRLPYERQGDDALAVTPTPLLNLSQHHFEPILLATLAALDPGAVHYGHEWESLEQDGTGVTARIRDLERGTTYEVRAAHLLAADGAGSRIRTALGIEMIGPPRLQSFLMLHVEADLRALVRDRAAIIYWILDPDCTGAFVAHDIDRTWVFMHPWDPDTESREAYTPDVCAGIVRRAIGRDVPFTIRDVSQWTMTLQIADRYRDGRVFLVGDAAHRFPPSGGLGMNTGIQDVHNLAWKLAAVERGWADAALLDTYEPERRTVALENADQSGVNAIRLFEVLAALDLPGDAATARERMTARLADPAGRDGVRAAIESQRDHFDMLGLQLGFSYETGAVVPDGTARVVADNPVRDLAPTTRPGARLPHAWVVRDGVRISTLDLVPTGAFVLLTGPLGAAWARAAESVRDVPLRCLLAGQDFHDPDGTWMALSGIGEDGALLVRPDQHVAWRATSKPADPAGTLAGTLRTILGQPTHATAAAG